MSSISQAGMSGIIPLTAGAPPKAGDPARIQAAAQQFEALLIAQVLRSAHDGDSGWLGSGEDSSGACATDYAEEQLAATIAQQGGFGLGKLIAQGLEQESAGRQVR
jgi:Rod binding domain-containing protein